MAAIVNKISINAKIVSALTTNKYKGLARTNANTRTLYAKRGLLEDFSNHIVTQELLQDPQVEGSQLVNRGNLVTLLGFKDGAKEVEKLKSYLERNINLDNGDPKIVISKNRIDYQFKVNFPNQQALNDAFPTPDSWSSRSWLQLIEKGINNVIFYFFAKHERRTSRSGFGLQLDHFYADGKFTPIRYISELFENFKARISR